jgi:ribonuclease HI
MEHLARSLGRREGRLMLLTAFTDGACRVSNPGVTSAAWILYDDTVEIARAGRYLGPELHSNNFAEYSGLVDLLKYLYKNKIKNVTIYCDSKLVVEQVNDRWDVNEQSLISLWRFAYPMLIQGEHNLYHIKGHSGNPGNEAVDRLCNDVLDQHKEDYETVAKD